MKLTKQNLFFCFEKWNWILAMRYYVFIKSHINPVQFSKKKNCSIIFFAAVLLSFFSLLFFCVHCNISYIFSRTHILSKERIFPRILDAVCSAHNVSIHIVPTCTNEQNISSFKIVFLNCTKYNKLLCINHWVPNGRTLFSFSESIVQMHRKKSYNEWIVWDKE